MRRYRDFFNFQAAAAILDFAKIGNFNGRSAIKGECASPYQISSKSVKRLQRYGNLPVFKMAAVRHLRFLKFKFLTIVAVKEPICHHCTKFHKDQTNRCDFCAIQDGGHRHLGFSKMRNFNGHSAVRGQFASPCQISSKSVERLHRYGNLTVFKIAVVRHLGLVWRDWDHPR